jgi:uncharacterized membrane protein (Fun14 family)
MSTALSYIPLLGSGAVIGFGIGFVAKRLGKYLLILGGIYFASLLILHYQGLITIHNNLGSTLSGTVDFFTQKIGTGLTAAAVTIPLLGAFAVGLYLGVRRF